MIKPGARAASWIGTHIFLLLFSGTVLLAVFAAASLFILPDIRQLERCFTTSMYSVHLCPGSANYVKIKEISPYVLHAVIAAEDGTFYSHQGFDWHEIEASLTQDLREGRMKRGGSTLTQQLAKNVFLSKEKSLWRKVKEAYLAYAIEKRYGKDFILEKYLNVVEFGKNVYGVKAAAALYFHKSPSALNPLEAAYLAFLLPNPKVYAKGVARGELSPFARRMVTIILRRMSSYGKLSPAAHATALDELNNFPWSGLSMEAFAGTPSYSLDGPQLEPEITDSRVPIEREQEDPPDGGETESED